MKPLTIMILFSLLGMVLEASAFFVGIAFTGVKDFGPYWYLAAIYYIGFEVDWLLPNIPTSSRWSLVYVILPTLFWALIGVVVALVVKRLTSRVNIDAHLSSS